MLFYIICNTTFNKKSFSRLFIMTLRTDLRINQVYRRDPSRITSLFTMVMVVDLVPIVISYCIFAFDLNEEMTKILLQPGPWNQSYCLNIVAPKRSFTVHSLRLHHLCWISNTLSHVSHVAQHVLQISLVHPGYPQRHDLFDSLLDPKHWKIHGK
jgi:hypothetical protein